MFGTRIERKIKITLAHTRKKKIQELNEIQITIGNHQKNAFVLKKLNHHIQTPYFLYPYMKYFTYALLSMPVGKENFNLIHSIYGVKANFGKKCISVFRKYMIADNIYNLRSRTTHIATNSACSGLFRRIVRLNKYSQPRYKTFGSVWRS